MKKEIFVSIIIPVYNVEKYLKRCLNTVVNQTLKEIEIILVDDGSTDCSGLICDEYKEQYPELIKVIHQENQGLGPARNTGLSIASGRYIGFVDSDDWIAVDMYDKLYHFAVNEKCDVVLSDMFYVDASKSTITKVSSYYKKEKCTVTREQAFLNGIYCYVWNKLYKAEIIKEQRFPNLVFEDIPVITKVLAEAKKIGYLPEPFYYYERKSGTLSTSFKSASILDTIEVEDLALEGIIPECREVLLFAFAKRFLQNIFSERKVMAADLVEHINCYRDEFRENSYVKKYKDIQRIYKYLDCTTIPKRIYYSNFGGKEYAPYENACINSWKTMTRGFEIIELNTKNCDVSKAPISVKNAFEQGDYKYVGDYYKLKAIFENGGLAIEPHIYFTAPIGQLRMETTFFGWKNKNELMDEIWGSVSKAQIVKRLLEVYEDIEDSPREEMQFIEKLSAILFTQYGLKMGGWTQSLTEGIKVFKCDTLAYDMQSSHNIAKLMTEDSYKLIDTDFEIVEKSVLEYWSKDRDSFWKQKEELRKAAGGIKTNAILQEQLNVAHQEIAMYKNSKSWRVTEPLRRLYTILHKK